MFGTSGIRELYGKGVTEELALRVANVFAENDVAIGRDTRRTGPALMHAAIAGIVAKGKNAIDLGIVPTPTVALATKKHNSYGIMLTASHNPEEYNGLKFIADGIEISRAWEKKIEKAYSEGTKKVEWDKVGKVKNDKGIILNHIEFIKKLIDADAITKKKPKVVIDCNGAGAAMSPVMLKQLGCEVVSINDEMEGFARASEPCEANLSLLSETVRKENADLGIAHDGDADRAVAVDENGKILPLDAQLAMMSEHEMSKSNNKKIISTMEASLMIRETVEKVGGEVLITPVGSLYVAEALDEKNALFGGEPCGEYIFKDGLRVPDGPLTAAKLVEIFVENGKLSELGGKYRSYPMSRQKFKCEKKFEVVEEVKKEIKTEGKVNEEDGIRVDEDDGWFLIRASGTEPIVRLTMEYKDKDKLESKKKELEELIKRKI